MSVKYLHADARALIKVRFDEWSVTVASEARKYPYIGSPDPRVRARMDWFRSLLEHESIKSGSPNEPCQWGVDEESTKAIFERKVAGFIFVYHNAFYAVSGPYDKEEARLLLVDWVKRKKQKAGYLIARKDVPESALGYERQPISEDVRHEVWRRDSGRCTKCGSVHNLEFDHVIPVSLGGANTTRNIQLLCETCNRRKSNNLG